MMPTAGTVTSWSEESAAVNKDMSRLDQALVQRGLTASRSQAESYIKLGKVRVNGRIVRKTGRPVDPKDVIELTQDEQYVGRAGLKLAGVVDKLALDFEYKTILDVGSSTGGFTDVALRGGAKAVIAVDVGSDQMHPDLRQDPRVKLYEKTDIRDFKPVVAPDMVLIDVSFISLRQILPHIADISGEDTQIIAMVKPQFEAGPAEVNKGVIKNDTVRRHILHDFESWVRKLFVIEAKADSNVAGAKGNLERFYLLKKSILRG